MASMSFLSSTSVFAMGQAARPLVPGRSIPPYGLWHVSRPLFGYRKLATHCAVFLSQSEISLFNYCYESQEHEFLLEGDTLVGPTAQTGVLGD